MYYNVDMLLVQNPAVPIDERVLMVYNSESSTTYHNGRYWAELARMMSNNLGLNLIKPLSSSHFPFWMQSDHYSFIREGYDRAMFAFETGWAIDDAYHQPTDTWDNRCPKLTQLGHSPQWRSVPVSSTSTGPTDL